MDIDPSLSSSDGKSSAGTIYITDFKPISCNNSNPKKPFGSQISHLPLHVSPMDYHVETAVGNEISIKSNFENQGLDRDNRHHTHLKYNNDRESKMSFSNPSHQMENKDFLGPNNEIEESLEREHLFSTITLSHNNISRAPVIESSPQVLHQYDNDEFYSRLDNIQSNQKYSMPSNNAAVTEIRNTSKIEDTIHGKSHNEFGGYAVPKHSTGSPQDYSAEPGCPRVFNDSNSPQMPFRPPKSPVSSTSPINCR